MKKILVIEDNTEVRENLVEILELSGYEVYSAEQGKEGVQMASEMLPDLILCDVMMPELDGFGVLRILSKNPKAFAIPFIFLTAKAEKTDFRKGMNLGADDYLTKPFDDTELLDAIEMRLQKHERMNKNFDGSPESLQSFIDESRGQESLNSLKDTQKVHLIKKKETLYHEGDQPRRMYYLVKGKVKIFKTNEWGKEYITEVVSEGQFFGYQPLIAHTPYQDSAATLEDAEVCFIPGEDFTKLLYGNRDLSARFIRLLANEVEDKEAQLLNLAYNSIRKRVANALIKLYHKDQNPTIKIQREDLASLVGTAKESVIRTLTDLKSEGLISINRSVITIEDKDGLESIMG